MKRLSVLLLVLLVTSLIFGLAISCAEPEPEPAPAPAPAPTPEPKEPVILRLTIPSPAGDKLTVNAEELGQKLSERTNGAYQIKVYPGEQLVKVPETMDAVRTGAVEMASIGLGIFAGIDPGLAEIPLLYNNVRANAAACRPSIELYNEILRGKLNQLGVATYTTGGQELESKKPVKTLEDWKGLLVGATNPEGAALATSLGASPVVIMWTECYSNLEKGVVDAVLTSTQWTIISGLADVSDYVTRFYATPTFNTYLINLDIFNKMPKDAQDILIEEAWKASDEMSAMHIAQETEDKDTLIGLGMEVYDLPKAERDRWIQAVKPYVDEKLASLGDFGAKIRQIAEKANADNP
jgi:TRAP-type C4-dicarboxylate transport system substrate-binding protein